MKRTIFIIAGFILTSVLTLQAQSEESLVVIDSVATITGDTLSNDSTTKMINDNLLLKQKSQIKFMKPHHFNLNIGGGIHTMLIDPSDIKSGIGFDGLFEAKYQILPKHVGLSIGAKISLRRAYTSLDNLYTNDIIHKDNKQPCTLTTQFDGWKEKESMWCADIPVQILFASGTEKPWNFIAGLGASLSIPFSGRYQTSNGTITTKAYFEQTKVEYEKLIGHGVGTTYGDNFPKSKIKYALPQVSAIVDLGLVHNVTDEAGFYIGLYGQYGILNACKKSDEVVFDGFNYQSILASNIVSKVTPLEAGVKLGLYFSFHDVEREVSEANKILSDHVDIQRQYADEAAAERATKEAEKNQKAELERLKQERIRKELQGIREASRQEANEALAVIKASAKYANANGTPFFPATVDEHFLTLRKYLESNSDAKIIITGHTDNSGTPAKNIINGQHRAEAFKTALVKKNIPSDRIGCVSKGETEPIADNDTEEGRQKNCRVDLDIVDQITSAPTQLP